MKAKTDIEVMIYNIKEKISNFKDELVNAMIEGTGEDNYFMNEISELQRQEQLLEWVLN